MKGHRTIGRGRCTAVGRKSVDGDEIAFVRTRWNDLAQDPQIGKLIDIAGIADAVGIRIQLGWVDGQRSMASTTPSPSVSVVVPRP